ARHRQRSAESRRRSPPQPIPPPQQVGRESATILFPGPDQSRIRKGSLPPELKRHVARSEVERGKPWEGFIQECVATDEEIGKNSKQKIQNKFEIQNSKPYEFFRILCDQFRSFEFPASNFEFFETGNLFSDFTRSREGP